MDGAGFAGGEAAGANDGGDFFWVETGHFLRSVGELKQLGGDLVDSLVGALGRKHDSDEQGVGVLVVEGNGRVGVEGVELVGDKGCSLSLGFHQGSWSLVK